MYANDIVNVTGGTLNSNNATALGTLTAVNVASGRNVLARRQPDAWRDWATQEPSS